MSTAKTGKHGHAKCTFTGLDIFTGKKYEDMIPAHQNVDVPHVKRKEYTLLDIQDDGFVSLMTDSGETKDDLKLPHDNDQLSNQIQKMFDEGKQVVVTMLAVRLPLFKRQKKEKRETQFSSQHRSPWGRRRSSRARSRIEGNCLLLRHLMGYSVPPPLPLLCSLPLILWISMGADIARAIPAAERAYQVPRAPLIVAGVTSCPFRISLSLIHPAFAPILQIASRASKKRACAYKFTHSAPLLQLQRASL